MSRKPREMEHNKIRIIEHIKTQNYVQKPTLGSWPSPDSLEKTWAAEQSINTIGVMVCSSAHGLFEHQLTPTRLLLQKIASGVLFEIPLSSIRNLVSRSSWWSCSGSLSTLSRTSVSSWSAVEKRKLGKPREGEADELFEDGDEVRRRS